MLLGEFLASFDCIDAGHEIGHIEFRKFFFAVTQRLELESSAPGKGFGKEREGYRLFALVSGQ